MMSGSCPVSRPTVPPTLLRMLVGVGLAGMLLGTIRPAHAQEADTSRAAEARYTLALRGVPLDEALQTLVSRARIDLAYSTALTEGRTVYCQAQDARVERLLSCVLEGTGVEYLRTASGSYLLVESPDAPPPVGRIAGRVVDATTGEPLPNANVLLADAGTGTATNQAGQFAVAPVLAGEHRLVVTYVGYQTAVDSVQVPPHGRDTVRVALSRNVMETRPVIVDGLQRRLPSGTLGRAGLDPSALARPSARGTPDVLRSASRQVGVSLNRPLAEISVQGGDGGEHVMHLDGVPVREPVSLGGLLSAFSPQALGRLTVHKAGFGAAEGSYTAGVLEARHDLSRAEAPHAALRVDPLSVDGRADVEWQVGGGTGRAMVAARSSLWDAYRAPSLHSLLDTRTALDRPLTPSWTGRPLPAPFAATQRRAAHVQFRDLHGAVRQEITPFQQLFVSGYRGTTRLGTDVASVVPEGDRRRLLLSQDRYDWTNSAVQGRYEWLVGGRASGSLQLWGSRHDSNTFFGFRADSLLDDGTRPTPPVADERIVDAHSGEGNQIAEWGARATVDVSVSSDVRVRAGVAPRFLRGTFRVRNPFLGVLEHTSSDWRVGSYAEAEVSPGLNLTATAGTRLTYLRARDAVYAEPRLSLRYDGWTTPLGDVAVRLAGGLYRQYVTQAEISSAGPTSVVPSVQFWLPVDRSLAPTRAYHAAGSLLLTPSEDWSVRLETYYKWQPRTLQVDYAGLVRPPTPSRPPVERALDEQADLLAAGRGRAYGAAVHLQRDGERLSGSVSAEWGRTERRYPGRFGGRFVPAPWEQPLRLAAALDATLTAGVHALAHWTGTWGRTWALRRGYYDYLAPTNGSSFPTHDLSRPGRQTLAPFSRLDLGVKGETAVRGVTLEAQVSLVNVLDRRNPFDRSLGAAGARAEPTARTLPGRRAFVLVGVRF
ncbi:MAG: carboxypeptidase-like regulatory domain-containing protein [Salinibacter sp.]